MLRKLGLRRMSTGSPLEKLRSGDVPVISDPCRSCLDPCDDPESHPDYPSRSFYVDHTSQLLGTVKPYGKQVSERQILNVMQSMTVYLYVELVRNIDG